jgi:hypothetical protein
MSPEERMRSILATLRAADTVEALEAAWPGLVPQIKQIEDWAAKRKRPALRHPRPTIDPRDGSVVLHAPEARTTLPPPWQEFWEELGRILATPVLRDPRAAARRERLEKFRSRIHLHVETYPRRPTKPRGRD